MLSSEKKHLNIGVIVFEGIAVLDFVGPCQFLEFIPHFTDVRVTFTTISHRKGELRSGLYPEMGLPLSSSSHYQELSDVEFDILLIPGGWGRVHVLKDADFMEYIRTTAARTPYVLSVCTGAAILASTGLIDGLKATTNKMQYNKIAAEYPKTHWIHKARWVVDGKFWTSSGVAAGMDMANAFIQHLFGNEIAKKIATYIEIILSDDADSDPFAAIIPSA